MAPREVTLTVLGSCGAWPEANRACSGFLLVCAGYRLVVDLGFGCMSRLLAVCDDVDAVVITHEHPDHCVDLNALLRARFYASPRRPPIPLWCTPGVVSRLTAIEPHPPLAEAFSIDFLPASARLGPFQLESFSLPHHVPNAGVRLTADRLVVAYTGDSGPGPWLAELGRNADLFIVESTFRDGPIDPPYLTTAREAGRWAAVAGARRLLLTHFWPGSDRAAYVADAREEFAGPVDAADEGLVITLGGISPR